MSEPVERRVAFDGVAYSREQFRHWYGHTAEYHWLRATPVATAADVHATPGTIGGVAQPAEEVPLATPVEQQTDVHATADPIGGVAQPAEVPPPPGLAAPGSICDTAIPADVPPHLVSRHQSRLDANRTALPLACVGFDDLPLVAGRGDEM